MSIVFAGTPLNAAVTLRELYHSGTPISLVLTRPDAPVGRKAMLTPSPVAMVAEELGIQTIKTNQVGPNEIALLGKGGFELAIVVAFGVILRKEALSALPKGWFNLHYSLLPKWRGASPVQRSLIAGDKETGVTLFQIDTGLDTGPIVNQVPTEIQHSETSGELLDRLSHLGVSLLQQEIPGLISGLSKLVPQSETGVSVAPKLNRSEGHLDFNSMATELFNRVRGVTPEPGAWTEFKGETFKLHSVRPSSVQLAPGLVSVVDGRVLVGCSEGSLELLEVQPAGKPRMKATDWLRGQREIQVRLGVHE